MPKIYRLTIERYDLLQRGINTPVEMPSGYVPGHDAIIDAHLLKQTNRAWRKLAGELGFDWTTVRPHPSGSHLLFYAEPLPLN